MKLGKNKGYLQFFINRFFLDFCDNYHEDLKELGIIL